MVIGSLAVNVVANVNRFTAGLKRAQVGLEGFVARARTNILSVQTLIGGILAGAAVSFVERVVEQADAMGDMAEQLNVSVEGLQKMRYAAEQMGSSAGTLDKALNFLNKTVGRAILGEVEQVEAFERLGIGIDSIKRMKPDEMFLAISGAIQAIPNEAEQAALTVDIFGRAGQELLPMLRSGSDEIRKFGERLEELGGVASAEAIARLGELDKTIKDLKASFTGFKLEFLGTFGPQIQFALDNLINRLKLIGSLMDVIKGKDIDIEAFRETLRQSINPFRDSPTDKSMDPMAGPAGYGDAAEKMSRLGPLPALVRGTREAFTASLANFRPQAARGSDPANKIAANTDKQLKKTDELIAAVLATRPGGPQVVGFALNG